MHSIRYPQNPKFEELLTSCGSMTAQLKQLHYDFSVELVEQQNIDCKSFRTTLLKLNNTPVIIAQSSCQIQDDIFYQIIKNADTTPIGKYLFAKNSNIIRHQINITQIAANLVQKDTALKKYITDNYPPQQLFWLRRSMFSCKRQQLSLIEIVLPNINQFFE